MPVKSPFSHVIEPNSYVSPIDLNQYSQGIQYKEGLAKNNLSLLGNSLNALSSIPAYGVDQMKLQEKLAGFKQQLGNINMTNLGDLNTLSQIGSIVNQAKSDPEIMAIAQRGNAYQSELKAKKDAEDKGKQYISPLLRQADKYYNSGTFLLDEKFNKSGFIAPDNKELDEIAKNTPEWENWVTKGKYDIHQKGKAESSLYNNYLAHFTKNPNWSNLLNDQFEQSIEGVDLNDLHNQGIEGIKQLFPYLPADKQQEVLNDLNENQSLQNNPYTQTAIKDKLRNDYFQNQAYMAAQAKTYVNTVDKRANDYAKSARDFEEAKALKLYEHQLDQEYPKNELKLQASSLGFDTIDDIIASPANFGKKGTDNSIILKEIPAVFNTDVYKIGKQDIQKEATNPDGTTSKISTTKDLSPKQVTYNPTTKKFRLYYGDGEPAKYVSKQEIINDIAIEKPSLAKYLKDNKSGKYPLPEGQAQTIKQDGYTYTWNTETGQYE